MKTLKEVTATLIVFMAAVFIMVLIFIVNPLLSALDDFWARAIKRVTGDPK